MEEGGGKCLLPQRLRLIFTCLCISAGHADPHTVALKADFQQTPRTRIVFQTLPSVWMPTAFYFLYMDLISYKQMSLILGEGVLVSALGIRSTEEGEVLRS